MANPEHVGIVKQGTEHIAKWREQNPGIALDLSQADLRRCQLYSANVSQASFRGADLEWADFRWADAVGCDFSDSNLSRADFHKADLRSALFRRANLSYTNFEDANVTNASFSAATFFGTRLFNVNLSVASGFETSKHLGHSLTDRETIAWAGKLPDNFLQGIGVYSSFSAAVYRVAIGSPTDIVKEGVATAARETIYRWNDHNSLTSKSVLLPVSATSHGQPAVGGHPQHLFDSLVLSSCQILIALFWTRLGSPTPEFASGTVHEIETFHAKGKPVMVYFWNKPLPHDFDRQQWDSLQEFKRRLSNRAWIEHFDTVEELDRKLSQHLTDTVVRGTCSETSYPGRHSGLEYINQERARKRMVVRAGGRGKSEDAQFSWAALVGRYERCRRS